MVLISFENKLELVPGNTIYIFYEAVSVDILLCAEPPKCLASGFLIL